MNDNINTLAQIIPTVTFSELPDAARMAHAAGMWLSLQSAGGSGKSSAIKIIADALNIPHDRIFGKNLTGMGPQEVLGYGIPDDLTKDMVFSSPEFLPTKARVGDEPCIYLADEFGTWANEIQAQHRGMWVPRGETPMIGTHEISKGVFIVLTGNRRQDGSRAVIEEAPIVNRRCSYELISDLDQSLKWYAEQGLSSSPAFSFLAYQAKTLGDGDESANHFNPPIPKPWNGAPHPTPRSWEAVLRMTTNLDETEFDKLGDLLLRGIQSVVGLKTGLACYAFLKTVGDVIPIVEELRGGRDVMPTSPSEQYAIIHVAARVALRDAKASRSGAGDNDLSVAVADGTIDWVVNRVILCPAVKGELRSWAYDSLTRAGLPLENHPLRKQMQTANV